MRHNQLLRKFRMELLAAVSGGLLIMVTPHGSSHDSSTYHLAKGYSGMYGLEQESTWPSPPWEWKCTLVKLNQGYVKDLHTYECRSLYAESKTIVTDGPLCCSWPVLYDCVEFKLVFDGTGSGSGKGHPSRVDHTCYSNVDPSNFGEVIEEDVQPYVQPW